MKGFEITRKDKVIIVNILRVELVDPVAHIHSLLKHIHSLLLHRFFTINVILDARLHRFNEKNYYVSDLFVKNVDCFHRLLSIYLIAL